MHNALIWAEDTLNHPWRNNLHQCSHLVLFTLSPAMLGWLLLLYLANIWNLVQRKHGMFKNLDNPHKKYFLLLT